MAWTSPSTWVAAATLTAAQLNEQLRDNLKAIGDPMTAYTPALTNWTLGNGTIAGKSMQAGKFVRFEITLTLGSTTVPLSTFVVSLPVAPAATAERHPFGIASLFDTSASAHRHRYAVLNPASSSTIALFDEGGNVVNATVPWTWATGDRIHIVGSYQAA